MQLRKVLSYFAAVLAGAVLVALPAYVLLINLIVSIPLAEMSLIKIDIKLFKATGLQQQPQFKSMRNAHCMVLSGSLANVQRFDQWQIPFYRFEHTADVRANIEETHQLLQDTDYCTATHYQSYLDVLSIDNLQPLSVGG